MKNCVECQSTHDMGFLCGCACHLQESESEVVTMMEFRVHTKDRIYVTPIDTVADASRRFQQIVRQGYYTANEKEIWIKIPYHAILKFEARTK